MCKWLNFIVRVEKWGLCTREKMPEQEFWMTMGGVLMRERGHKQIPFKIRKVFIPDFAKSHF